MTKEWLNWINRGIAALVACLLLGAVALLIVGRPSVTTPEVSTAPKIVQASSFQLPQESYDAIDNSVLTLKSSPITLQLPDLRQVLIYYGKNNRPDADPATSMLHFGIAGTKTIFSTPQNTPAYLVYDKKQTPPRYQPSPDNTPTSLWIEAGAFGPNAVVKVRMKTDRGELVTTPLNNAEISLNERPYVRTDMASWEIGKQRVDGTLLARQRAKWYGTDRFLERHGGKEYEQYIGKQRIDFGDGPDLYPVFVKTGDSLIWDQDRWKVVEPGEETLNKPILVVKKVDERLISFELWDAEGKTKITLNLLKSNDPTIPANVMQGFKYVGSRTRSQFVFEVNKERLTLSPLDWLLQIGKGWKKLSTPEEIDAYVDRKDVGYLFVFDGIERRDDRQIIMGALFNKARSDYKQVEMSLEAGAPLITSTPAAATQTLAPKPGSVMPIPGGITPPQIPQNTEIDEADDEDDDEEDDERQNNLVNLELHPYSREDVRSFKYSTQL